MLNKFEFEELVYEKASVMSSSRHRVIKIERIAASAAAAVLVLTAFGFLKNENAKQSLNIAGSITNESNYYKPKINSNKDFNYTDAAATAMAEDSVDVEKSDYSDDQPLNTAASNVDNVEICYTGKDNYTVKIDSSDKANECLEKLAAVESFIERTPKTEQFSSCITVSRKNDNGSVDLVKRYLIFDDFVFVEEYVSKPFDEVNSSKSSSDCNRYSVELSEDFILLIRTYFDENFMSD